MAKDVLGVDIADAAQIEEELFALGADVLGAGVAAGVRAVPGVVVGLVRGEVHGPGEQDVGIEIVVGQRANLGELVEVLAEQPRLHRRAVALVGAGVRVGVQVAAQLVGLEQHPQPVRGLVLEVDDEIVGVILVAELAEMGRLDEELPQVVVVVRHRDQELHAISGLSRGGCDEAREGESSRASS